ncbi:MULTISPECIES: DUF3667 domain-containing protein [unclassified Duganella]|uniref:DUF3667 domain-containing protein n=1 Tax=unclassified Duganella TaxID=2636909 RepID=UPI00087ED7CA|nr:MULTISPECIES: DUF3667 domain-containing protein [unclassified Duganella]SDG19702.1 Protein of unknown function [Duganella sp. OV458]SDJ28500.1 Protein of unknown function [Duganella sp. OV510]
MSVTPANCANCEAPLSGHYCSNCGQEAVLHHASTREFLHEFVGHYVALEGKLWGSLARLVFRPGLLTNEYMRGRRVRFVQPLRLYLSFSLLFFVLLKLGGFHLDDADSDAQTAQMAVLEKAVEQTRRMEQLKPADPAAAESAAAAEAAIAEMRKEQRADTREREKAVQAAARSNARDAAKPAPAAPHSVVEPGQPGSPERQMATDDIDQWLAARGLDTLRHKWASLNQMSSEQQKAALQAGFYRYAPYAIFCLMPVFALYLKILYLGSGRRFGEHVLFALHTNAFAFLLFSVMLLIPIGLVNFLLWCWLLGYLPWAMRRVYHSGRAGTLLRWAVLMFFYAISIGVALGIAGALGAATAH